MIASGTPTAPGSTRQAERANAIQLASSNIHLLNRPRPLLDEANRSSGRRPIRLSTSSLVFARSSATQPPSAAFASPDPSWSPSSCEAGISPSPLKRLTSTFAPALIALHLRFWSRRPWHRSSCRPGSGDRAAAKPGTCALSDQLRHLAIEEGHQQRGDMGPVDIRIGHDDDPPIAQPALDRTCRGCRSPAPRSGPSAPGSAAASRSWRWQRSGSCRAAAAPPGSPARAPAWPSRPRNRPRR